MKKWIAIVLLGVPFLVPAQSGKVTAMSSNLRSASGPAASGMLSEQNRAIPQGIQSPQVPAGAQGASGVDTNPSCHTDGSANPACSTALEGVRTVDWHDAGSSCASYRGRINVLDCGGDNTDTRDNTAAIQLALRKATGEEEIYFPSGTYRVESDIRLPEINKKVTIVGESLGVRGRKNEAAGGSIINYTGTGTLFMSDDPTDTANSSIQDAYMLSFELRDISLQGSTVSTTSVGLNIDGMNHVDLDRVRFRGFYKGLVGVTVAGRAAYALTMRAVNFRSYGTSAYPNAEYGTYHLMDTAIQLGAYGGNRLFAGHYTLDGVHTEQVRAGLVLTDISNLTSVNLTVDTSCSAIVGYGVEFSTFVNSYLDANPSHATKPFPGCGTHVAGRRIQLVGGRGNVIWPTQGDGQGADPNHPDMIQPETTTVISPAGSEDRDTITRFSGAAMKLGDSMNLYVANGNGIKSYIPASITLTAAPYTSVSGTSITFTAANTLSVGQWVAFKSIQAPRWILTHYYYYVTAADASSFTLAVPFAADGTSGMANGNAYYDGTKISVLRTTASQSVALGDYDTRWPINIFGAAISLNGSSVNLLAPSHVTTNAKFPLTITSTATDNGASTYYCNGISAGGNCGWWFGHDGSTKNAGYLRFNYSSSGSDSNYTSLGFYGGSDLWALFAGGDLYVGSSPADHGYKLEVNGAAKINDALTATGDVTAPHLQVTLNTPASSYATCTAGQIWADANYVYVCTATNTVKRASLNTF